MQEFIKDPDAVLDYTIDWETWLDGDTISTSTWTVPDGITQDTESESATAATIWLSGGTAGEDYEVVNEITTTAGRTENRTLTIKVRER